MSWIVLQLIILGAGKGAGGPAGGGGGGVYFVNISGWNPPALTTPLVLTTKTALEAYRATGPAFNDTGAGPLYFVSGGGGDVLIDLSNKPDGSHVTDIPLQIDNCNDLVIRGLEQNMVTQPGNFAGQLPGGNGGVSYYNRIHYGARAIAPDCNGDVWIEGVSGEYNGMEGDVIVYRGTGTPAEQNANIQFYVVNSRFRGMEGEWHHQDCFQNQGAPGAEGDIPQAIRWENTTCRHGMAGVTIHNWDNRLADVTLIRTQWYKNNEYQVGSADSSGAAAVQYWFPADILTRVTVDDLYYYDDVASWWVALYNGTHGMHYGAAGAPGGTPGGSVHAELFYAHPSTDFAPADKVGRYYVSPWCTATPTASYCPP